MAKKTITLAGKLKRFYGNFTDRTQVVFTLENDSRVHNMCFGCHVDFDMLRLTAPGDEIRVEFEEVGWLLKENIARRWENLTVARELDRTPG